jgi:hypothetical protein
LAQVSHPLGGAFSHPHACHTVLLTHTPAPRRAAPLGAPYTPPHPTHEVDTGRQRSTGGAATHGITGRKAHALTAKNPNGLCMGRGAAHRPCFKRTTLPSCCGHHRSRRWPGRAPSRPMAHAPRRKCRRADPHPAHAGPDYRPLAAAHPCYDLRCTGRTPEPALERAGLPLGGARGHATVAPSLAASMPPPSPYPCALACEGAL